MDEALFQFEFPETPGALLRFLNDLPQDLNVSLFHYRSHGADVARVLVAFQVPAKARPQLREYLEWLASKGFKWQEERSNDIYDRFLLEPLVETHKTRKPPPITPTEWSRRSVVSFLTRHTKTKQKVSAEQCFYWKMLVPISCTIQWEACWLCSEAP
jgi:hypothetical protein